MTVTVAPTSATRRPRAGIRSLASDDASYVTGETLVVDGGWTIQGMREMLAEWR